METTRVLYIATVKSLHHRVDHSIISIQSEENVKSKIKKSCLIAKFETIKSKVFIARILPQIHYKQNGQGISHPLL